MKTTVLAILAAATLTACAPLPYENSLNKLHMSAMREADEMARVTTASIAKIGEAATIEAALKKVRYGMKDPDSAQFRNVRIQLHAMSEDKIICGEVNGKNSYGGYVGFVKFIASPENNHIQDTSNSQQIMDASNAGLDRTCYR
ncbi:MAG: hypothetical protein RBT86_06110 [Azospira sp.]|nr:hypothetical protein [Azospira sp.]